MVRMPRFASKTAPDASKLRGGYYTPVPIAHFVAAWVAEAGPNVLEPSCGDGAILTPLSAVDRVTPTAVELFADEAAKASEASGVDVVVGDFFQWFGPQHHGTFDGVAGNPPYIRFGSWVDPSRSLALDLMRAAGVAGNRLTNAWVPFVVASLQAVRPGGRVGLVIPAELLQVGYAAPLRAFLVDNCSDITVLSFRRLVFPGILQEVVLLLAEKGPGPATIQTAEVNDAEALESLNLPHSRRVPAALHESEKWTKYYLEDEDIQAIRRLRADIRFAPLRRYASVDVGVVSGRNAFFCMSRAAADDLGLGDHVVPLVSRSNQIRSLRYTSDDLAGFEQRDDVNTRLLAADAGLDLDEEPALARYIAEGEAEGVNTGYKCRIRRQWWSVPSVWIPDGFMLRQISTNPRLSGNEAGATSTDTVHRVRVRDGVSMPALAAASFNSVTFAMSEVLGRSYGGGILELEPSEAELLPVPSPERVSAAIIDKTDELLRDGRTFEALEYVDRALLMEQLGLDEESVLGARRVWERLQTRRTSRGGRQRP
jgi:adenine-specific DNA methylase